MGLQLDASIGIITIDECQQEMVLIYERHSSRVVALVLETWVRS